jgi:phosphohistidine swiveling domain-containing protein/glycerol-3-phosphate acyltransferase PlsY
MTLEQVLGVLLIFTLCPILGGLPLIGWLMRRSGQQLTQLGTGNLSVSAAFYHGGRWIGILAVLSEAFKGIAAVLLARYFFPIGSVWEVVALIALVMGRYWVGKGAGTTNVVWGFIVHDWITAGLVGLISGIGFTLVRERQLGKLGVLVLLPIVTALRHPNEGDRLGATVILSLLLAWIYQKIPDDLDLPSDTASRSSRKMFRFFRGDRALVTLDKPLDPHKVGAKAANLSQLRRWGYPVPVGWVLPPGDDPAPLIELLHPSPEIPLVVRSSAIGEDSETASAAGQYDSILNLTSQAAIEQAILRCQASYHLSSASRYRQDKGIAESGMAVVVQLQVQGVFSGVAFSRDPIACQGDAVVIEALPGMATQVVSGQVTPEQYRVWIEEDLAGKEIASKETKNSSPSWLLPEAIELPVQGKGDLPPRLIQQVAYLARHIEQHYHGVPQDIEWSYDGQHLWLLQARPITTLLPIWTRKIAAEVIPGYIHPLTWSINRPLTCGVWGEIFTIVLGDRANGLDFNETATLHHSAAYFNASLLGQLFRRMGLPPESLEFLTRGAKFSQPPLRSTLQNAPGLLRLLRRELSLEKEFAQDVAQHFDPGFARLTAQATGIEAIAQLSPEAVLDRIDQILALLNRATYYSILAPLSAALRQASFAVDQAELDHSHLPEVASVRSLAAIATQIDGADGDRQAAFDRFLQDYGYLSDVATDIAVPTWQEDPRVPQSLLTQFLSNPAQIPLLAAKSPSWAGRAWAGRAWKVQQVQRRLDLKGQVTALYSKLLAELRWSFVALEQVWLQAGLLAESGDIFFLHFAEIQELITAGSKSQVSQLAETIATRRLQLEGDRQVSPPQLVYGNSPPQAASAPTYSAPMTSNSRQLKGIGASPGQVEGHVVILQSLQTFPTVSRDTILVVPYADSGWAPLLAQAGGLIAEVGGQLSHGAIVAREYGIPAVMNIAHATQRLRSGQKVRLDGRSGTVDLLS